MPELRGTASSERLNPNSTTTDAIIGVDADGFVISATESAAAVLGYSRPDELYGLTLDGLIGDEVAGGVINRIRSAEAMASTGDTAEHYATPLGQLIFTRNDGTAVPLNAILAPDIIGGRITLHETSEITPRQVRKSPPERSPNRDEIAATLRTLADQTNPAGGEREICTRFADALRTAACTDTVFVARSSGTAGLYETIAYSIDPDSDSLEPISDAIDLPPALIPQRGTGPISVESLGGLALFDPVIIGGEEASGAYMAARAEYIDGSHILVIATALKNLQWQDDVSLLLETGAHTLSGTLRTGELGTRLASSARAHEAVRQIGVLASQDLDGRFLESARRVIARRLPVSVISIHVSDPVTSQCYVAASTGGDSEGLVPGFTWPLAGSIEQRVLKSGAPLFISASTADRVAAPPTTIAHWRAAGLQTVVAVPLREAGEVVAVLVAGFSSALSSATEVVRLLESITPAVHLGVGLSGGRPTDAPEPDESEDDPGFVSPQLLLAITRAAAESPDSATLFASVTEWLLDVVPSGRIAWGTVDQSTRTYRRHYYYDTASNEELDEADVYLAEDEIDSLRTPGFQLMEPGHNADASHSMRVGVLSGKRVLGVVTAWARDDEQYTTSDMARLQRICEFISGPLDRISETEAVKDAQRKRAMITEIGVQAAGFYEPAPAFRAVRPLLSLLFPYERALFIDIDSFAGVAAVQYNSAISPIDPQTPDMLLASLPSPEIAEAEKPLSVSLEGLATTSAADAVQIHPLFANASSLLAVPVTGGDDSHSVLLLLSATPDAYSASHIELAAALSDQLVGAQAGWQAHRLTRDWRRDLRETQKQLNLILDSAPVALVNLDIEGTCTRLEGHGLSILGIHREDVYGKSIFEMTGAFPELEDAIRQAMNGIPASAVTKFGAHSAEVWAQPVTEIDGTVTGVTIVGYDISDRVRIKKAVADNRELQRTIRDFSFYVSNQSHELRNSLLPIGLFTDILADSGSNLTEGQVNAVSNLRKSTDELKMLIDDLLSMDSGNYDLEKSPLNVGNLMREIVDSKQLIFSLAKQTITLSPMEIECTIEADQLRLTQVITNLLSNASKHSQEGAEVCLDVAVSGSQLKISVIDNGPGIPADQLDRVWDRGIRLPSGGTLSTPGKGLGLPIVKNIVELHGGTATIESTVGAGTTVTVTLPGAAIIDNADVEEPTTPDEPETKPKRVAGRRKRLRRVS
jgi:PAS domain S-box-containing protein